MNQRTVLILCLVFLLTTAVFYAPLYLIVSDQPVKSDAVVLFLGGEVGTREKKANQLVMEGYTDYLIIPAYRHIKKQGPDGNLIKVDIDLKLNTLNLKPRPQDDRGKETNEPVNHKDWFVENTHEEAIIARYMMASLGITTAIMVSSPYHMRRINLISERVFGERSTICYVPTRYETPDEGFWLFKSYDRKIVLTEYLKIAWFLLYSSFV